MNINNKTILITGGGSGIGLAIAGQLLAKGNTVLITGRTEDKLKQATAEYPGLKYFVADVTKTDDVTALATHLKQNFGGLDVLINNAGQAYYYDLNTVTGLAKMAADEIQTNYLSIINLTEELLPLLKQKTATAIVNVSSIVALVPGANLATYSASKAALHAYTQTLRHALSKTGNIKVFELMPPLVNTDFSTAIGGENGIPPSEVADSLLNAFENDIYEIHTGNTEAIYQLQRTSPQEAFQTMNKDR